MTGKKMLELIQQHHPHIGETEALLLINEAKDEFCERTEISKTTSTSFTTVAGQLLYDLALAGDWSPGGVLKINKVWIGDNNNSILASRLQGTLVLKDLI